jgi:PKHD-type hydroxylase
MPSAAIVSDVFTGQECRKIIEAGLALEQFEATANNTSNDDVRQCKVGWFDHGPEQYTWIHQRMARVFEDINNKNWCFDLDGAPEYAQFTAYQKGDHFDWHMDVGDGNTCYRKLSSVVHLNSSKDYNGGILQLHVEKNIRDAPQKIGSVIIFPSYSMHKVTPVTDGVRYSLVQWSAGIKAYR